jgi:hypothetical protein
MDVPILPPPEKRCTMCGGPGPFYRWKKRGKMAFASRCIPCSVERLRLRRKTERHREWSTAHSRSEKVRAYRARPEVKARSRQHQREWYLKNKWRVTEKVAARQAVSDAIKRGRLERMPCELCGARPADAHHHMGYSPEHRLSVRWLCKPHHAEAHVQERRERRRALRAAGSI